MAVRFDRVEVLPGGPVLDATARAGALTGIVCDEHADAARLPDLLARESDPPAGRLLFRLADGRDIGIADLALDALRRTALVSPHDAVLLPGSIADNLRALTADERAVTDATRAAQADQVLETVPAGADGLVGDRGETLSGGQRQRVSLARALAAEPPVLVLHDPTTAVDAATEDLIARRTAGLRAGRTTIVVTTSPAWLARCDRVVHLSGNSCVTGSHAELLDHDPAYRLAVRR
ncbi:ATP-binding cassette domain-containing protein [Flexivirga caeni]|uniref:ATP-binding cassette domain-containing protein n=1 Tax=Flexivirga caeni TaxID=2294115 RepID=UPI0013156496|nr:ABC transporter ATP-binding protein [Flexivirga caeni]